MSFSARGVVVASLAAAATLAPLVVLAQEPPPPPGPPPEEARPRFIAGRIAAVDYGSGLVVVDTLRGRRIRVFTLPTTSITATGDPSYHDVSDLHSGQRVRIEASRVDHAFDAQVITIDGR